LNAIDCPPHQVESAHCVCVTLRQSSSMHARRLCLIQQCILLNTPPCIPQYPSAEIEPYYPFAPPLMRIAHNLRYLHPHVAAPAPNEEQFHQFPLLVAVCMCVCMCILCCSLTPPHSLAFFLLDSPVTRRNSTFQSPAISCAYDLPCHLGHGRAYALA